MSYKDRKFEQLADDFREFLYEITDNQTEAAISCGISKSTFNNYLTSPPGKSCDFKAYMILLHPKGLEICRWLLAHFNYEPVPKEKYLETNGRIDDEIWKILKIFVKLHDASKANIFPQDAKAEIIRHVQIVEEQFATLKKELSEKGAL